MKTIKLTTIFLAFLCVLTACGTSAGTENASDAEESPNSETEQTPMNADGNSGGQRGGGSGGGGRGGMTAANDPEIQSVLDENAGKYATQSQFRAVSGGMRFRYERRRKMTKESIWKLAFACIMSGAYG